MDPLFIVAFVVAIAVFLALWGFYFTQLMCLEDADFPGRFDKILWVFVFAFLFLPAPFLFLAWRGAMTGVRESETSSAAGDSKDG